MSAQPSESWDDPASLIALKAVGCDCRQHGYVHIHDLCIADAAKVRPAIVPLVEAARRALPYILNAPYEGALPAFEALRLALNPEEAQ